MNDAIDQELVSDLARDLLTDIAPNELPIFRAVSEGYFASGGEIDGKRRDEKLGFGLDFTLLTPYILSVVGAVTTFLATEVLKAAKGRSPHPSQTGSGNCS